MSCFVVCTRFFDGGSDRLPVRVGLYDPDSQDVLFVHAVSVSLFNGH